MTTELKKTFRGLLTSANDLRISKTVDSINNDVSKTKNGDKKDSKNKTKTKTKTKTKRTTRITPSRHLTTTRTTSLKQSYKTRQQHPHPHPTRLQKVKPTNAFKKQRTNTLQKLAMIVMKKRISVRQFELDLLTNCSGGVELVNGNNVEDSGVMDMDIDEPIIQEEFNHAEKHRLTQTINDQAAIIRKQLIRIEQLERLNRELERKLNNLNLKQVEYQQPQSFKPLLALAVEEDIMMNEAPQPKPQPRAQALSQSVLDAVEGLKKMKAQPVVKVQEVPMIKPQPKPKQKQEFSKSVLDEILELVEPKPKPQLQPRPRPRPQPQPQIKLKIKPPQQQVEPKAKAQEVPPPPQPQPQPQPTLTSPTPLLTFEQTHFTPQNLYKNLLHNPTDSPHTTLTTHLNKSIQLLEKKGPISQEYVHVASGMMDAMLSFGDVKVKKMELVPAFIVAYEVVRYWDKGTYTRPLKSYTTNLLSLSVNPKSMPPTILTTKLDQKLAQLTDFENRIKGFFNARPANLWDFFMVFFTNLCVVLPRVFNEGMKGGLLKRLFELEKSGERKNEEYSKRVARLLGSCCGVLTDEEMKLFKEATGYDYNELNGSREVELKRQEYYDRQSEQYGQGNSGEEEFSGQVVQEELNDAEAVEYEPVVKNEAIVTMNAPEPQPQPQPQPQIKEITRPHTPIATHENQRHLPPAPKKPHPNNNIHHSALRTLHTLDRTHLHIPLPNLIKSLTPPPTFKLLKQTRTRIIATLQSLATSERLSETIVFDAVILADKYLSTTDTKIEFRHYWVLFLAAFRVLALDRGLEPKDISTELNFFTQDTTALPLTNHHIQNITTFLNSHPIPTPMEFIDAITRITKEKQIKFDRNVLQKLMLWTMNDPRVYTGGFLNRVVVLLEVMGGWGDGEVKEVSGLERKRLIRDEVDEREVRKVLRDLRKLVI